MTLPDGYRMVDIAQDRQDELLHVDELAFAFATSAETAAIVPITLEWDRTAGVERPDGELAAVHSSYRYRMPVPGGDVACAGLTWVGVRPDERRRGLLSAMIDAHFARSLARGEVVSALWAAESAIYGRFGYGAASTHVEATLARRAPLRDVPGADRLTVRFDTVAPERDTDLVQQLHVAAGAGRPGWFTRSTDAWRRRAVADPPAWRDGGEPLRIATVHDAEGEPRGYALVRRKETWAPQGPRYTVRLREVVALDAAAARRLWGFLLDLDLTSEVGVANLATDDVLLQLLLDVRGAQLSLVDNLWVRVLDVAGALEGRSYAAPLDVVLELTDARVPANAGRWRLTTTDVRDDGTWAARAARTEEAADVALDVRELGAAYLGGRSMSAMVRAGLAAEHRPGAAAAVTTAFSSPLAPVCSYVW
ncbi:GNAT family N-acetyltransferase [Cellulomonas sp. HZM]|uniref:GNAT family N-acetyltransferase n=1 Tax=Cellulomonas sp. HZM TaxID=1454010 RepID=UPI0004939A7C|nr:GNAT family N-acetyltransferase [Cellulomonas sp. HZM]